MAGTKLYGTKDRAASHRMLEDILVTGTYPRAACREDENDAEEPYTVWSDSPDPFLRSPDPPAVPQDEEAFLERLTEKLLARLERRKQG